MINKSQQLTAFLKNPATPPRPIYVVAKRAFDYIWSNINLGSDVVEVALPLKNAINLGTYPTQAQRQAWDSTTSNTTVRYRDVVRCAVVAIDNILALLEPGLNPSRRPNIFKTIADSAINAYNFDKLDDKVPSLIYALCHGALEVSGYKLSSGATSASAVAFNITTTAKKHMSVNIAVSEALSTRQLHMLQVLKAQRPDLVLPYVASFSAAVSDDDISAIRHVARTTYKRTNYNMSDAEATMHDNIGGRGTGHFYGLYMRLWNIFNNPKALVPTEKTYNNGECVGVEIECFSPFSRQSIERMINSEGIRLKDVRCGNDASIKPPEGHTAYEFRCLTNINDMSNLKALCEFLVKINARVNVSCGLHVHLDMRGREKLPEGVVSRLVKALPLLVAMVPEGRRKDQYCTRDEARGEDGSQQRYAKINSLAFNEHKTIEVRLHSGTVNFGKISNWIKVLHSIANAKGRIVDGADPMRYASALRWDAELLAYVQARIAKFETQSPQAKALTYRTAMIDNTVDFEMVA